mgnify:CR=1 FL=1|tara:strand:+ start:254 stop:970 length:717 start_codon:yes stop_codon:yes gene_type:complete
MKIIIFTTDTIHHCYYINRLIQKYKNIDFYVICEQIKKPSYINILDKYSYEYEKKKWFNNKNIKLEQIIKNNKYRTINNQNIIKRINYIKPDVIISYGIGKIKKEILDKIKVNIFNLHGGNPEEYRGLDSHLWAIYHNDYKNLKVCLHKLEEKLDTGKIYKIKNIPLYRKLKLYKLRSITTEICILLTINLINNLLKNNKINLIKQNKIGRYYSEMPNQLKLLVYNKFNKYTSVINND